MITNVDSVNHSRTQLKSKEHINNIQKPRVSLNTWDAEDTDMPVST